MLVQDLASRLLGLTVLRNDFDFLLAQASPSDLLSESLRHYLPPNLSIAETALVTAHILVHRSSPEKIELAIAGLHRIGSTLKESPTIDVELVNEIQQFLVGNHMPR